LASAAAFLLLFAPVAAHAQQATTVSGRVMTDGKAPLQGASVTIPTTGLGATTDAEGRYSFTVPTSRLRGPSSLTARRIGFVSRTVSIDLTGSAITQDFTLTQSAAQLTGVVVTALSQQREKSTIATSQQEVSGDELNRTKTNSVVSALSGKVSGLQISQSGNMGGTSRIVIRGASSILGQNQPLFIVDGLPVSNQDYSTASASGGRDYGSAIQDINMDDVESVTVLKGPNAAALYGSRASNGAVVITTKTGRGWSRGTHISFTSRFTNDAPSVMPKYQNQYGQGFGGEFNYVDGAGGGTNDGADESWGPKMDGRTTGCVFKHDASGNPIVGQYDTSVGCDQFTGKAMPWMAHPDNVNSFFRSGSTVSNNLTVSQSFDQAAGRLSITRDDIKGMVPNTTLGRTTSALSANATVFEKLDVTGSLQYSQLAGMNRPENGYTEGNPFMTFTWFGRQVDVAALKRQYFNLNSPYGFADGSLYNWNDNYHRNPYWQFYDNAAPDTRDRIVAQVSANYTFTPWLTGLVRGGADNARNTTEEHFAKGNIDRASPAYNGGFTNNTGRLREMNFEGLLTARKTVSFADITANLGGNRRRNDSYNNAFSTNGILVEGIYNLANAGVTPTATNSEFHSAVNSTYGSVIATMKKHWTVEVTGRNDWSSTLPKDNASYFYPSVNSSLILSDLFPWITSGQKVSYLKLRGGWARVGSDAGPYQLATVYNGSSRKFGSLALFTLADQSANAQLKPEQTIGSEGGIEAALFSDRVTFDGTYYSKISRNQVLALTTAPATGFSSTIINAGQISNRGFEGTLSARVLRSSTGVSWTSTFNYLRNRNKVDALAPGLAATRLSAQWSSEIQAREGEPYGVLFGYAFLRDSATHKILTANGLPLKDGTKRILGNVNPDWTGGWINEVRYRAWTLNALLDIRRGGQNFSVGNWFGTQSGVLANTLRGREVDWNNPGLVVDGIDKASGKQNTTTVIAEDYNHSLFGINEAGIYNTGFVKLREVQLGWEVPSRFANRVRAQSLNIAFVARNLHTWTDFPNYDPENAANAGNGGQGYDMGALPTLRSIGLNVTIVP